ncbi:hypothetical protein [Okeania sp. SIO2B3]|uniref:hypothetical protein n=1 Tax=Okeania sp. SIO2B3 TaxID=2607784 RepID=UPI0013C02011|nr:hypothetical protein [Okeania sp. SIO2B3]NET42574.1 hypothetical protein [Okeania sp. SIO2B3]
MTTGNRQQATGNRQQGQGYFIFDNHLGVGSVGVGERGSLGRVESLEKNYNHLGLN